MSIEITEQKKTKERSFSEFLNRDISFGSSKMNDKRKERFFSDLHTLLGSGIDIKTTLEIMESEHKEGKEKELLLKIRLYVENGKSFSEAMKVSEQFSPFDYFSVQIGEESGKLNDILKDLQEYYNKKISQKRILVNAFSYPVLVLAMAIIAVLFMTTYMIPMFVDIFKRFNAELPALTQLLVDFSAFLKKYNLVILFFIIAIVLAIRFSRKNEKIRYYLSFVILKIPFVGNIVKTLYMERFFQTISLLSSAKTPLTKSLNLISKMIRLKILEDKLLQINEKITYGSSLHKAMDEVDFFEKRTISLIKVGEEVNKLESIFRNLHKQYSDDLNYKMSIMSSMIEPILIIFVGILVAIILVAMYLPMFSLSTTMY